MALTPEIFALKREQIEAIKRLTDDQVTDLVGRWVKLWDDLQPELQDAIEDLYDSAVDGRVSQAKALRHKKLTDAINLAEQRIAQLSNEMADVVSNDVDTAVKLGAFDSSELVVKQLPPGYTSTVATGFGRVPTEALDAITLRTTERIHSLSLPLTEDMVAKMRRELVRGIAVGDNPRATARRIMQATEQKFNGGLTRAMTIARTEMLDAYRAGSQQAEKDHTDVIESWVWGASLSGRTCPACLAMHGSVHDVDEPGPYGHQNCRCARLPKTKSWAELGFKGITEPADTIPSASAWFDNLTPDSQRTILGPAAHTAWSEGRFPMDQWAVRKENPGWRDSYVPARPPAPQ